MSRPTPEELRRRLSERLAAEPQRGQTMTQAPPAAPAAEETPEREPAPLAQPVPERVAKVDGSAPTRPADSTPMLPAPELDEKRKSAPLPKPRPAISGDRADQDSPVLRQPRTIVRRNDESGRLRSHPVSEALYLDIARTKLRAARGEKLTWDAIVQHGLDLVLARPSQLESLLNEVDTLTSKARRTIAATISVDHDIAMQELLLDRPSIGTVRARLKLEDLWCAALIAWKRSVP